MDTFYYLGPCWEPRFNQDEHTYVWCALGGELVYLMTPAYTVTAVITNLDKTEHLNPTLVWLKSIHILQTWAQDGHASTQPFLLPLHSLLRPRPRRYMPLLYLHHHINHHHHHHNHRHQLTPLLTPPLQPPPPLPPPTWVNPLTLCKS